ncbi:retrovirus-related Pol polyprotein from transposon opus [Trichonephila clavipes]|nr:retrovirus-related Pol polyprotein from transposon opus [Trichonephila clavipes]
MGPKKTLERIKYSFFWEGLRADVKKFCESCKECQITRSVRIKNRSSSTPVARPELPFEVGNMDLIGPIDPPSLKGHKYILCLVDQHTRWGEAVPLTSLSAKVLRMLEQFVVSRIVDIDILMQIWKNRVKQINFVLEWVRWVGSEIIPAKGKLEPKWLCNPVRKLSHGRLDRSPGDSGNICAKKHSSLDSKVVITKEEMGNKSSSPGPPSNVTNEDSNIEVSTTILFLYLA